MYGNYLNIFNCCLWRCPAVCIAVDDESWQYEYCQRYCLFMVYVLSVGFCCLYYIRSSLLSLLCCYQGQNTRFNIVAIRLQAIVVNLLLCWALAAAYVDRCYLFLQLCWMLHVVPCSVVSSTCKRWEKQRKRKFTKKT